MQHIGKDVSPGAGAGGESWTPLMPPLLPSSFIVHRGGAQVKLFESVEPWKCTILAKMFLCDYVQWGVVLANFRDS